MWPSNNGNWLPLERVIQEGKREAVLFVVPSIQRHMLSLLSVLLVTQG